MLLTDVEDFAQRLRDLAEKYQAATLNTYAALLQRRVEEFDIEGLSSSLHSFPDVIRGLEKMSDS